MARKSRAPISYATTSENRHYTQMPNQYETPAGAPLIATLEGIYEGTPSFVEAGLNIRGFAQATNETVEINNRV